MLLFIKMIRLERANVMHFNTSHVTVYQRYNAFVTRAADISIHLMLLFIGLGEGFDLLIIEFQYISCYCLSHLPQVILH